jgi:hypothetical protein
MITWIVLARDVSEAVSVRGADRLAAVLILDAETDWSAASRSRPAGARR